MTLAEHLGACYNERVPGAAHKVFRDALTDHDLHDAARAEYDRLNQLAIVCLGQLHRRCSMSERHRKILEHVLTDV